MLKKIFMGAFIILVIGICFIFINVGYHMYVPEQNSQDIKEAQNINIEYPHTPVVMSSEDKITPSTKMVYKYFYKRDEVTETVEDVPSYFLLELTREDLERDFSEWEVKSFSSKEVVLQKVIDAESTQNYKIGGYDGFLAVFYEKPINGKKLKEITDIPIESLAEDEQIEVKKGISIKGKDALIKFIQNYES